MSADDWKPCPRCHTKLEKLFNTHKDNQESPLNFEEIKNIERLKQAMKTGWPQDIKETDVEKEKLVSAEDKLRESKNYDETKLIPSRYNANPVEIRYEWSIEEDGAWFSLDAVCRNCGHNYEVEKR